MSSAGSARRGGGGCFWTRRCSRRDIAVIEIEDLHKHFGAVRALDGVSLSVAAGEVVCLIGPSGSGKSTLLRCINFLEEPTSGVVRVNGRRVGVVEDGARTRRMSGRELAAMRAD